MRRVSKIFWVFVFIIAVVIGCPREVNASEKTDEFISRISTDGQTAVFKSVVPKNDIEADFLINGIVGRYIDPEGYNFYAWCEGEGYTTCNFNFQSEDYESKWDSELGKDVVLQGESIDYTLTVTYDEPSDSSVGMVNKYISQLRDSSMDDVSAWYEIEDLSLINYYMTSTKSELWNRAAPGRALKYVKELNEITEGSDLNFYLDVRAGSQDETLMYESAFGPMIVFYGDYAYTFKEEGLYLKRVIYIPEETADTKEAYVAAAQKRINDYLGDNSKVVVSYGGLLSSLEEGSEDSDKPINSDGNYYNVEVLGRTYKFYIVKGTSEQLVEPSYNGKNLETNISISSNHSSVPLDTMVKAERIDSGAEYDKILEILDLDDNVTYDVKLYSAAKEDYITRLDNGTFDVRIPLPDGFEGKDYAVYYVTEDGKPEVYDVTPEGDFAKFNTNHFSVYTLGYKTNTDSSYKVVLDANGGKFGTDNTYVIDKWENELYDSLVKPTRDGFTFEGYYTEKDGGTKFEMILNESGIDSDMTFYAQWKEITENDQDKTEEENPKTFDDIQNNTVIGIISLIGLVGASIYLKNKVRA